MEEGHWRSVGISLPRLLEGAWHQTPPVKKAPVFSKLNQEYRPGYACACVCMLACAPETELQELVMNTFVKNLNSCLTVPLDLLLHKISFISFDKLMTSTSKVRTASVS